MAHSAKTHGFTFQLITPETVQLESTEQRVALPAVAGDMMVLKGHTAMIVPLRSGIVRLVKSDKESSDYFISGGFANIDPKHCVLTTENMAPLSELNKDTLTHDINLLEQKLSELAQKNTDDEPSHEQRGLMYQLRLKKQQLAVVTQAA